MDIGLTLLFIGFDCFRTQELCIGVVGEDPWYLAYVSDHIKIQEMCDDAVNSDSYSLKYASDWFMMQELVKI